MGDSWAIGAMVRGIGTEDAFREGWRAAWGLMGTAGVGAVCCLGGVCTCIVSWMYRDALSSSELFGVSVFLFCEGRVAARFVLARVPIEKNRPVGLGVGEAVSWVSGIRDSGLWAGEIVFCGGEVSVGVASSVSG